MNLMIIWTSSKNASQLFHNHYANKLNREKKFQFQMCVWVVALLPQRPKLMFFEIFLHSRYSSGTLHLNKLQKTFILVFEVIVQPPKHTFEIGIFFPHFSSHCVKCPTKSTNVLKNSCNFRGFFNLHVRYVWIFKRKKLRWYDNTPRTLRAINS